MAKVRLSMGTTFQLAVDSTQHGRTTIDIELDTDHETLGIKDQMTQAMETIVKMRKPMLVEIQNQMVVACNAFGDALTDADGGKVKLRSVKAMMSGWADS